MNFLGIEVVEHPLATMTVPNRVHKQRSSMSAAYHRRIQKKWRKRFGTHQEPCAFIVSMPAAGLPGGETIFMHPERMALLRNFT